MIKFRGTTDGRTLIGLGLSRSNTERLLAGEPIPIDTRELGLEDGPMLMIFAGETEDAMAHELRTLGMVDQSTIKHSHEQPYEEPTE